MRADGFEYRKPSATPCLGWTAGPVHRGAAPELLFVQKRGVQLGSYCGRLIGGFAIERPDGSVARGRTTTCTLTTSTWAWPSGGCKLTC